MSETHQYEVNLQWIEDRRGTINSPVLPQEIEIATPPDFPKGISGLWSPEHLFVGAINSCFMTTFLAIAENSKLDFVDFKCNAVGIVDKVDGKFQVTEVTLKPCVSISEINSKDRAIRVLEMSEKNCLISNSVNSKVTLHTEIKISDN
jgi:peroxiredoxin-like protein